MTTLGLFMSTADYFLGPPPSTVGATIPVDQGCDAGSHLPRHAASWQRQGDLWQGAGDCGAVYEPSTSSSPWDGPPNELGCSLTVYKRFSPSLPDYQVHSFFELRPMNGLSTLVWNLRLYLDFRSLTKCRSWRSIRPYSKRTMKNRFRSMPITVRCASLKQRLMTLLRRCARG
jgi:hypothetical protein